jgi:hypothetical protein
VDSREKKQAVMPLLQSHGAAIARKVGKTMQDARLKDR